MTRNVTFGAGWERYPRRTVRLIEIRLLEGPNVYRLEPAVKVELAIGRRRTWYGQRSPARHALVHLGAHVPARDWPLPIEELVGWIRRLRIDHGEGRGGIAVHRSSDPGHWIVTFGWSGAERARTIAEAAVALAERDGSSVRRTHLTGAQERLVARWTARIAESRATPPAWIRDADRRIPIVSITGTNGKSTVTRLITHILKVAGRRVGTTTSDGILVDERLVEPGDWTGPGGAWQILARVELPLALPVIVAGLRIAAVTVISVTVVAAYVNAGGLGTIILAGIQTDHAPKIWVGALTACALAVTVDLSLARAESWLRRRGTA